MVFATSTALPLGPPGRTPGGAAVVFASAGAGPDIVAFRPMPAVNTNRTKTTRINHLFI